MLWFGAMHVRMIARLVACGVSNGTHILANAPSTLPLCDLSDSFP
jgi:hypothetical protein